MARSRTPTPQPESRKLTSAGIAAAIPKIKKRIEELKGLQPDADQAEWDVQSARCLAKLHTTLEEIFGAGTKEFRRFTTNSLYGGHLIMGGWEESPHETRLRNIDAHRKGISDAIGKLETAIEILEEQAGETQGTPIPMQAVQVEQSRSVFIVHGHDEASKEATARFISKLGLEPVILHEKANSGRTVIEKFEKHADVGFAVVLLTPDDVGGPNQDGHHVQPRARQNVVLELGYFLGKLGRGRVCALKKGDIEIPSDFSGVVYVDLDAAGAWKFFLAKELKEAGFTLDTSNIL